jgi:hypothetical protein
MVRNNDRADKPAGGAALSAVIKDLNSQAGQEAAKAKIRRLKLSVSVSTTL